jgi:hypothetical protein
MPYYKHWTKVVKADDPARVGGNFIAYCTGCDWNDVASTRYYAVQKCENHFHQMGEGRKAQRPEPKPSPNIPAVYSDKVAKLLNLAVDAPGENEAIAALAKARAVHAKERVA